MNDLIKEFLSKRKFAVVGSFKNKEKIAYKILINLKSRGYEVYPINPNLKNIDEFLCYKSILDLPFKIDVVNVVTPPEVSLEIVKQCLEKSINYVWFQPGASDFSVLEFCKQNNIKYIDNVCIMMTK